MATIARTSPQAPHSSSSSSFLVGIVLGSSVTLAATLVAQKWFGSTTCKSPSNNGKPEETVPFGVASSSSPSLPIEIREEQLSRHTLYFGTDGMKRLRDCRICVVGLGGVGSHTAHMLARGGVGYLRLIDFDQVTLSSLNRHACATLTDVGTPKATCLARFLRQICPDPAYLQLDARVEMFTHETAANLLALENAKWDIIIDAIDDVPTKAALIAHCLQSGTRVLSCMGAGGKADMTRLHVSDLKTAAKDPLASKLRQSLKKLLRPATINGMSNKKRNNNDGNDDDYLENMDRLAILFSSEQPVVKLADFTPHQLEEGVHEFGAVDGMRIRVLPVLGTMPAIMGQALAALALTELGGKPIANPVTGERIGRGARHKIYQRINHREQAFRKDVLLNSANNNSENGDGNTGAPDSEEDAETMGRMVHGKWIGPLQIDMDDVEYLLEIWRNRCAVTGARLGVVLELVRWNLSQPSTCDNLVLMSVNAINKLVAAGHAKDHIPQAVRQRIEERLASCRVE